MGCKLKGCRKKFVRCRKKEPKKIETLSINFSLKILHKNVEFFLQYGMLGQKMCSKIILTPHNQLSNYLSIYFFVFFIEIMYSNN